MSTLDLSQYLEQPLTVTGLARDARAGAIVLPVGDHEDKRPVYVAGLKTWGDQEGRTVSVSGILRLRAIIAIATVDKEGSVSHGLDDAVFVIDDPSWKIES